MTASRAALPTLCLLLTRQQPELGDRQRQWYNTNATGNRVLNALEDVVFTLTRESVVPTGVMLTAVPGLTILAGALVVIIAMRKRKEGQAEA